MEPSFQGFEFLDLENVNDAELDHIHNVLYASEPGIKYPELPWVAPNYDAAAAAPPPAQASYSVPVTHGMQMYLTPQVYVNNVTANVSVHPYMAYHPVYDNQPPPPPARGRGRAKVGKSPRDVPVPQAYQPAAPQYVHHNPYNAFYPGHAAHATGGALYLQPGHHVSMYPAGPGGMGYAPYHPAPMYSPVDPNVGYAKQFDNQPPGPQQHDYQGNGKEFHGDQHDNGTGYRQEVKDPAVSYTDKGTTHYRLPEVAPPTTNGFSAPHEPSQSEEDAARGGSDVIVSELKGDAQVFMPARRNVSKLSFTAVETKPSFAVANEGKVGFVPTNQARPGFTAAGETKPSFSATNDSKVGFVATNQSKPGFAAASEMKPGSVPANENKAGFVPANENKAGFAPANENKVGFVATNQIKPSFVVANQNKPGFAAANESKASFVVANQTKPGFAATNEKAPEVLVAEVKAPEVVEVVVKQPEVVTAAVPEVVEPEVVVEPSKPLASEPTSLKADGDEPKTERRAWGDGAGKSWASLFNKSNPQEAEPKRVARVEPFQSPAQSAAEAQRAQRQSDDPHLYRLGEFLCRHELDHRAVSLQPRGLTNRGNWCYINSTLQALLACPPFYNLMKGLPLPRAQHKSHTPIVDSIVQFVREFVVLNSVSRTNRKERGSRKEDTGTLDVAPGLAFEPTYIYKMLNSIRSDTFKVEGRQEDAEEFLSCLLNALNDEMLEVIKLVQEPDNVVSKDDAEAAAALSSDEADEWKVMGPKNKGAATRRAEFARTPISDIFRGNLRSRVQRAGDQAQITDNVQPFFTLQLDIEKAGSVREALELLAGRDQLEGVTCTKTNQEVEAWQQVTLDDLPLVLVLHLKWFDYRTDGCTKIVKSVEFPVELKLDHQLMSSTKKYGLKAKQYKLFAVVYHDGKEASKGHYVTDAFHVGCGGWVRYDDSAVRAVTESQVLHPKSPRVPYLLYYRRSDTIGPQASAGHPPHPK